ncbi:MAG: NADPH-dependent oxidoreductase [Peptostreptococcaceae bacterium]|nr:NADPH-dependent oxidoreductase [Peptostreptococcaceae bacterium]
MNEVIKNIQSHRSIRSYTGEPVRDEDLQTILKSAIHAPSSINGQQWSVIVVKDQAKKDRIAELTGGQEWISKASVFLVFVMDYHRAAKQLEKAGIEFKNINSIEAIMVGSVDVGLAFGNAMNAAESLGYAIVPIGAIRNEPYEMIKLLNLPKYVYPVLGMCIGVGATEQPLKPRLPYDVVVSDETYNADTDSAVAEYDETIRRYMMERSGGQDSSCWSDRVKQVYSKVYYPKVYDSLKQQGFKNEC